jgi:hypothetical protein
VITDECQHGVKLYRCADWKRVVFNNCNQEHKCFVSHYNKWFELPYQEKEVHIFRKCHHNEVIGLHNRYLKDSPSKLTFNLKLFNSIVDELIDKLRPNFGGKMDLKEFMAEKKGKLRARYDAAVHKVTTQGFDITKDSDIKAFLKHEIYSDATKAPRFIMGRNPIFNLIYGLYTTPLEHAMSALPQVAKGKNFRQRGDIFFDLVFGWKYIENDFSKFESTQTAELLKFLEMRVWRGLMNHVSGEEIYKLFFAKMSKCGYTQLGAQFKIWGCRGSGDMDTGLFNTLLNWVACRYFEIINGLGHGNFIVDGDDSVIQNKTNKSKFINTFAFFCLEAKLIPKDDYHDVDFCSSRFLQYKPGKFIQVQDIHKIMANVPVLKTKAFEHCVGEYFYSLGYMYSKMYHKLPFFSSFAEFLMRQNLQANKKHHYFKPEIIQTEKYGKMDMMDDAFECDYHIFYTELCMAFSVSPTKLESIISYLQTTKMSVPADHDKKFRKSGYNPHQHTEGDYDTVQKIMEMSMNQHSRANNYTPEHIMVGGYEFA